MLSNELICRGINCFQHWKKACYWQYSFLHGQVESVLQIVIPISSLNICWKGSLPWLCRHTPDLTISGNQSECSHKPYHSSLAPLTQLLKDSCDTHIMLTQIRPELCFSHLYPESSFASSPICRAVHKVACGAGEGWEARAPAVALAFFSFFSMWPLHWL